MAMDVIDYEIKGSEMQFVEVELDPGEAAIGEAGSMMFMDAAIGMINIAHNRRLNVFTVLSVVLMPPTLIASIYGMNIHLPLADSPNAFPTIMTLILSIAAVLILIFIRNRWL